MSELFTVERLSLSRIGDALRDQLGTDVGQYVFPDDFERAVVDVGFTGLVAVGTAPIYDELISIGDGLNIFPRPNENSAVRTSYKTVSFVAPTLLEIPARCFARQTYLENFEIPSGVLSIGESAFNGCTGLESITIPNTVSTLGASAFSGCNGLTTISAEGVTAFTSTSQFYNCTSLESVYLPSFRSEISQTSFGNCGALKTLQLGSIGYTVLTCNTRAFENTTQTSLTITVYTVGERINGLLTNIRNKATGATIVFKASADTTYDGQSYSAGDTILTSTP